MKRYRVFAEVHSYSILPQGAIINIKIGSDIENIEVRIKNQNAIDLIGREFSKSLSVITEVDADDIYTAVGRCSFYINQILDKVAIEVGMPVDDLKVLKVIELVEHGAIVEIAKFDYEVLDKIGSKVLNFKKFDEIVNQCTNDRISRALHWYRKAINETDILDIFSYFWISLEALNPLFKEKYPDAHEIQKCEKCAFEKINTSTAPLKKFFQTVLDNGKLYSTARSIRQGIVHGFEDINVIQNKLIDIIDDLEIACRKAIFYLLNLDINSFDYSNGIGNNESITFVSVLKIGNFTTDESDPNYFEPEINVEIEMNEHNGEVVIKPILNTNVLDHGCSLAGMHWDFFGGDPGYPIKKIQLEIRG